VKSCSALRWPLVFLNAEFAPPLSQIRDPGGSATTLSKCPALRRRNGTSSFLLADRIILVREMASGRLFRCLERRHARHTRCISGQPMTRQTPDLSIVVPVYNEAANIRPLVEAVREALPGMDWELVLVDDGSSDDTRDRIALEAATDDRIRLIALARNFGQTAAMQAGFDYARGRVVVSMDGDLQNDPTDIPSLLAKLDEGFDLVVGYRVNRQDKLVSRKVPSWIANRLIARLTGVRIRDNGCSLKAYRKKMLERIVLYSDMHRFIPAMAVATAGARVAEIPVQHHARVAGESKYGLSRVWKVLPDLLAIKMISSFRNRPLVMFGFAALVAGLIGIAFGLLTLVSMPGGFRLGMASAYVFPSVVLVWFATAFYLLLLGLIGEVVIRGEEFAHEGGLPNVREWS